MRKFAAFLVLLTIAFALEPYKSEAQIPGLNFGGRIYTAYLCPCSANYILYVGYPRPAVVMYNPYSSGLYSYYRVFSAGPWALGSYLPGGICLMPGFPSCYPGGYPYGTISPFPLGVGTSLI